jgi:hypothetical protein
MSCGVEYLRRMDMKGANGNTSAAGIAIKKAAYGINNNDVGTFLSTTWFISLCLL